MYENTNTIHRFAGSGAHSGFRVARGRDVLCYQLLRRACCLFLHERSMTLQEIQQEARESLMRVGISDQYPDTMNAVADLVGAHLEIAYSAGKDAAVEKSYEKLLWYAKVSSTKGEALLLKAFGDILEEARNAE